MRRSWCLKAKTRCMRQRVSVDGSKGSTAPDACVAEHPHPRRILAPGIRMPAHLRSAEHTFRMWHQYRHTTFGSGETGETTGRPVRIERIVFGRTAAIVDEAQGTASLRRAAHLREADTTFAMRDGHGNTRTGHALQEDARRVEYLQRDHASFILLGCIAQEFRPMLGTGNDVLELPHHLATIAYAERKLGRVGKESTEFRAQVVVIENGCRPTAACTQHVAKGEAAACGKAAEIGQLDATGGKIGHVHVDRIEPGTCKGRCHFDLAVDTLI